MAKKLEFWRIECLNFKMNTLDACKTESITYSIYYT